ncbi:LytS/YhcK type 5TM receptor domain-containing protein, partial [Oceanispirochaeta sp.]|uniref:LytS/YhcK type 5TM receptor domain-containing protein n=1 Tax=Oceanispirochaeta sp. TaxID=2035350 RepID=UPI00261D502F
MTVTLLIDIATNISLLLSLLFIQNLLIFQHDQTTIFSKSLQGVIIGVISIVLMNNSIFTHPGMIFDSRTVLLSVSGLFLGILPTIIAMFIAGVYRIWLGGTGMFVGVLSIIIATFLGILMGRVVTNKQIRPGWRFNFAFGLAVHSIILMLFFLLFPRPDNRMITKSLAIPYLLLLPLATSLVGSLLSFQNDSRVAQKKLLDNRELFHTLFRDNHTIMLIIDPESGDIQDANESAIKFYGWSYAEMKSMNIHQINMAPQHEVFEKIGVIQKNRELNFLAQHRRADDSIRDVEVFSETIVQNENPLLFSIIHDITDR